MEEKHLLKLLLYYHKVVKNDPSDLESATKLAEVLRMLGRDEESIRLYSWVARAHAHYGDLAQGIMICTVILGMNPNHQETLDTLAKLYARQPREREDAAGWIATPAQDQSTSSEEDFFEEVPTVQRRPTPARPAGLAPSATHSTRVEGPNLKERLLHEGTAPRNRTESRPVDPRVVEYVMDEQSARLAKRSERPTKNYATIQRELQRPNELSLSGVSGIFGPLESLATLAEISLQEEPAKAPFPLFGDLAPDVFAALIRKLRRRLLQPQEQLFSEGAPGDSLFLVVSGRLEVLKGELQLGLLSSGEFFGEFALLTDQHRHASVRALEECELLELDREQLLRLMEDYPSLEDTLRTFYLQRLLAMVFTTSPLLSCVKGKARADLLTRLYTRRAAPGETVLRQGDETDGFYIICLGRVSVVGARDDGTPVLLGELSEGDFFGEISLLTGAPANATVMAEVDTELVWLQHSDFIQLAAHDPSIWHEVQRTAGERQRTTQRVLTGSQLVGTSPGRGTALL